MTYWDEDEEVVGTVDEYQEYSVPAADDVVSRKRKGGECAEEQDIKRRREEELQKGAAAVVQVRKKRNMKKECKDIRISLHSFEYSCDILK